MSAIAGFWSFDSEPAADPCKRILEGQRAYGSRAAHAGGGTFACGRLIHAVLPEDQYDRQPLRRGPYTLVADVRLDNRDDVAAALGVGREQHVRWSDADFLFESLLLWGESAAEKLIGEFAFALWNHDEQSLLLGRDLFGHRPLHFHEGQGFFAFATMPSGLHALPRIPRAFDPEAMADDLGLLTLDRSRTLFNAIKRVEPGHLVRVTKSGSRSQSFWSPPPRPTSRQGSVAEIEAGLREVVDRAVAAQTRGSGSSLATHLSSGLDSSIVTATAALQCPQETVVAYTAKPRAGFEGPIPGGTIGDESELAALTASNFSNVRHQIVDHSNETLIEVLDRQFAYMQQPSFGPCNALWVREINRRARAAGQKVLLVGFTGNITVSYGGREAWAALLRRGRLPQFLQIGANMARRGVPLRTLAAQSIGPLLPRSLWALACRALGRPTDLGGYTALAPAMRDRVEANARSRGIDLLYQPSNDDYNFRLEALFDGDNGNYFKGTLGEFGISMRDPLSDLRVVNYCLEIPGEVFIAGGTDRSLARSAFADRLPGPVAASHRRGHQGGDWYEAVERDMRLLRDELEGIRRCTSAEGLLDSRWIEQALDSWPSSGWERRNVLLKYRYGMLRGVSAGHFMRKVSGAN